MIVNRRWTWALLVSVLVGTLHLSKAQGGGGSVSKKPDHSTDKAKIQMLQSYALAMSRSEAVEKDEDDDNLVKTSLSTPVNGICEVGDIIDDNSNKCKVHPLVVSYLQQAFEPEEPTEARDVYVAVSLDEGKTYKRINLSKSARHKRSYQGPPCFSKHNEDDGDHNSHDGRYLQEGEQVEFDYEVDAFKPMLAVKGNRMLVAWTSKDCRGGVPGGDGGFDGDKGGTEEDHDPGNFLTKSEGNDYWQVKGKQRCHDYEGELPGGGKVALNCVWAARGTVSGQGDIVFTKPERLTSGRRDAFQLVAAVSGNQAAWALAWQEDVKGLRVGEAAGPGDGMSGATVNHKTDIWYSFLAGTKFEDWEDSDFSNRPSITEDARFSTPVRVTDNAACKLEPEIDDESGNFTGEPIEPKVYKGGNYCSDFCPGFVYQPEKKNPITCNTTEGVILDGNTGASRVNMFLIPKGSGAEVVLAYEESKGMGKGPGDNHAEGNETQAPAEREDWGKNIYYHNFPSFDQPDEVSHGIMLNVPQRDANGAPLMAEDGLTFLTDNARRVRFIVQPPSNYGASNLAMVVLYREGAEGHGAPAHIIMRRFIGGYAPENLDCNGWRKDLKGNRVCMKGVTDLNEENTPVPGEEDDARAHRGFLRGDFLVVGYTYTPQWGRGQQKRYDFFVRRSFDGAKKFSNSEGQKEGPINLSNIQEEGNRGWSVMEPRIYATPGTIGKPKAKTKNDVQNSMVFYVAYGTTFNPHRGGTEAGDTGEGPPDPGKDIPLEIHWTMTSNWGESYLKIWNENATKWQYPWLAKVRGDTMSGTSSLGAPQIRINPAGTKLFASYEANVNGIPVESDLPLPADQRGPCRKGEGSDVCFNGASLDPFAIYDLNGDSVVDDEDLKLLKRQKNDLNEDGQYTGHDMHLMLDAIEEFEKQQEDADIEGRTNDDDADADADADLMDTPESDADSDVPGWNFFGFLSELFDGLFSMIFGIFQF